MKRAVWILVLTFALFLGGCADKNQPIIESFVTVTLPASFFNYCRINVDETAEYFKEGENCHTLEVYKDSIVLKLSDRQRSDLYDEAKEALEKYNESLREKFVDVQVRANEDYTTLIIEAHESISPFDLTGICRKGSACLAIMQIFNGSGGNWKVDVTIHDLDTNHDVLTFLAPRQLPNITTHIWNKKKRVLTASFFDGL